MSGFKTSLYVGGDATGAKKALAETTSALAGTQKATDSLNKSTAALDQSTRSAANENSNFATGEKAVQQAVTRSNTAVQQRIERLTGYGAATNSARQSAAAFGGTIDQNKASFDATRMSIDPVYRASRQYEAVVDETRRSVAAGAATQAEANRVLALAEAQYLATGQSAQVMGRSNNAAAGQMGNLVAQFNDIGVMMAAGQNPLTLALQQGTQISQVIGPMGAAGAVKALGGAFLGMLNPVSLITIGSIAAGAAVTSWLTSSKGDTNELEEALEELTNQVDSFVASAKEANSSTSDLEERFGKGAEAARKYLLLLAQISEREAKNATRSAALSLTDDIDTSRPNTANRRKLANEFDLSLYGAARSQNRQLIAEVERSYVLLETSVNGSIERQISALERVQAAYLAAAEASGGVNAEENDRLRIITEQLVLLQEVAQANEQLNDTAENSATIEQRKLLAIQNFRTERAILARDAASEAWVEIAQLTEQADLQALIAQHGEDSRQVTEARAEAERNAFIQQVNSRDISEELKEELIAAWDAANALSLVDIAAGISPAVAQAAALAQNLGIALNEALSLQNMQAGAVYSGRGDGMAEVRARRGETNKTDGRFVYTGPRLDANNNPIINKTRSGGGGGGSAANALKKEREAVTDLISGLEDELAILRESDPVQQEMLRHREKLAGATEAERAKISELIATRNREKTAVEEQKAAWDSYRDIAHGTFEDLRRSGGDLGGVLDTLSDKIQDMAFQALLLGEGPLAQILGTSGGGGLIDLALGAIFPGQKPAGQKLAVGGMVYGRGGGKSDQVPLWGSPGEYMVNAKATAKNRTLLEMINAGADIPGFANGGQIGGASGGLGGIDMRPQITIENHSSSPITQTRQDSVDGQGRRSTKLVLADAVGDAMTQSGGGAKRVLSNRYGLRQKGALR
ncbi:Prophage tail length tape measure protein [Sulfitobacter pontiacus]|uniref:Prophage tail length tape measure protein n=1 Tax=Sulfitobacter pontiacus TaxID=60137 RepID=A0A1H2W7N9_9RHOB|nr:phage tail length tape measure family protein [Sulfitobacter pontiacus]SDW76558.1 Prophage tail length tape measure protein [Sulfitobacter pontiacus]